MGLRVKGVREIVMRFGVERQGLSFASYGSYLNTSGGLGWSVGYGPCFIAQNRARGVSDEQR